MLRVGGNKQDFVFKRYLNIYQVFTEWQYDLKCTISFTVLISCSSKVSFDQSAHVSDLTQVLLLAHRTTGFLKLLQENKSINRS